ncbi:MAG TPA: serine hydrolase, partial [Bacteroidia bacterium]|nr:serine hydrolase [Bacteroidia bacterium]
MKSILRVALLFFSFSLSANAQDEATLRTRIDSLAGEQLKQTDGIGFIVGIYVNGEKYYYSYGANDPGTRDRADTSTIFEIGPLSETFTAVTYARLTIDGKIGYDDPLQKYLPVDVPSPVYQKIICS